MRENYKRVILGGRMGPSGRALRAIDLYCGIGGWTLGLQMARIDTIVSYEWWPEATKTYEVNFGRRIEQRDIRALPLDAFPAAIDVVVGSPPCTQFSYSNRGGSGDIADGLKDIHKFLEIVERTQPQYWVMENVPRVARILEHELSIGGSLSRFRDLVETVIVVDMAQFGLPQRRRRMLAGNFPVHRFLSYSQIAAPTLGDVVVSLSLNPAKDPIYGIALDSSELRDHIAEPSLTDEEARLNRDAKQRHPFYNVMRFPDPLDKTARTVTALCTRVSRESIIIEPTPGELRRLTLRERATLQGFPITYQFAGRTYPDRLKMIGNAIPPLLVYYIGHSLLGTPTEKVPHPSQTGLHFTLPPSPPPECRPKRSKNRYPEARRFRAVIPNLRFGSGVRFELTNEFSDGCCRWRVSFYHGSSKQILSVPLSEDLFNRSELQLDGHKKVQLGGILTRLRAKLASSNGDDVQRVWAHREPGVHPFGIIEMLRRAVDQVHTLISSVAEDQIRAFVRLEADRTVELTGHATQTKKLDDAAKWIFSGFVVGGWFNAQSGLSAGSSEDLPEAV